MKESIFLIGFMGSGKTTIGQLLHKQLQRKWIDLDHYIEEKNQMKIPDIFKTQGEDYFRSLEIEVIKELCKKEKLIISTGGGIVTMPENRAVLKEQFVIYLKWSFETLYERIKEDKNRPLVQNYNQLLSLYNQRESFYGECARITILCDDKTPEEVVSEILSKIEVEK